MLKSCKYCGKLHKQNEICPKYQRTETKSSSFRNSFAWQRKRQEVKQRDKFMCVYCFKKHKRITTDNLQVHHIKPLSDDFDSRLDSNNLITLCQNCHEMVGNGKIKASELLGMIGISPR